jgi:acetyltransferase-like isoleucine patch superfamily enzyme
MFDKLKNHILLWLRLRFFYSKEDKRLIELRNAKNQPWVDVDNLRMIPHVTIGRYTYGLSPNSIIRPTKQAPVTIGSFSSFAPGVVILAHADHPTKFTTTYPLKTLFCNLHSENFDFEWTNHDAITKGPVGIGHDVWVGQNALILSGVKIGNGAIIGAGAVVTKDIPSYAIAVGNPARVIKYRFSEEIIYALNELEWWNLSDENIKKLLPYFYNSPENLIEYLRSTFSKKI